MRAAVLYAAIALAACSDPPMTLKFALTPGDSQVCFSSTGEPAQTCADVAIPCDAVVSIRIFDPDQPTAPYVAACKALTGRRDLCSIAEIDLPEPMQRIPLQTLEVEMAVYPASEIETDPNTNLLICPSRSTFGADGLPIEAINPCSDPDPAQCLEPAIGGVAFYHPGDTETVVDLGCTNLAQLEACGTADVEVTSTVYDYDSRLPVVESVANLLNVSVGEPQPTLVGTATEFTLDPADQAVLDHGSDPTVPTWSKQVGIMFQHTACIEVLEDGAQTTGAVSCRAASPTDSSIDILGERLARGTLDQLLVASGLSEFPDAGMVVGIVLDNVGGPLVGYQVATDPPAPTPLEYLSVDRTGFTSLPGTTSNGIFVSQDAPFGTTFSVTSMGGVPQTATAIGGLIAGKVTIVVLQFPSSVVGG